MDREIMARKRRAERFARRQANKPAPRATSIDVARTMAETRGRALSNEEIGLRIGLARQSSSVYASTAEKRLREVATGTVPLGPLLAHPAPRGWRRVGFWPSANTINGGPYRYEATCALDAALMAIQDELAVRVAHRQWLREAFGEAFDRPPPEVTP